MSKSRNLIKKVDVTIVFIIWIIFLFGVLSSSYDLMNKSSTVDNIMGVITLVVFALISIKTKCFTSTIIKSKKNEGNEK